MRKLLMHTCLLISAYMYLVPGAKAQQADSLRKPQEFWVGVEWSGWFRNLNEGNSIVPEAALKYRIGEHAALNLVSGYHVIKRDSLFNNIAYTNRGWYLSGGAEALIPFSVNKAVHFTVGGDLAYSRFVEEMNVSFSYRPDEFGAVLKPGPWNRYEVEEKANSHVWALGLRQGVWIHQERFAILLSSHINFLLNRPDNPYMPSHYIPGIGTYAPQYRLLSRNMDNAVNSVIVRLRMTFYYRLF